MGEVDKSMKLQEELIAKESDRCKGEALNCVNSNVIYLHIDLAKSLRTLRQFKEAGEHLVKAQELSRIREGRMMTMGMEEATRTSRDYFDVEVLTAMIQWEASNGTDGQEVCSVPEIFPEPEP